MAQFFEPPVAPEPLQGFWNGFFLPASQSVFEALGVFRRRFFNWRLVRSLAELQILTKASYVMLILVPLLAGVWPAVRLAVNQYDKSVAEAAAIFDRAATRFAEVQSRLPNFTIRSGQTETNRQQSSSIQHNDLADIESLHATAEEFRAQVAQYKIDYRSRTIESVRIPRPFAAAFMAALAVVIAHMLYQMFAPQTLQRMTLDQYVAHKKDDYSKHRSPDSIEEAKYYLLREDHDEFKKFVHRLRVSHPGVRTFGLPGVRSLRLIVEGPVTDPAVKEQLNHYFRNLSPFELHEARQFTDEFHAQQLAKEFSPEFAKAVSEVLASITLSYMTMRNRKTNSNVEKP
jgi:hypothetical protein